MAETPGLSGRKLAEIFTGPRELGNAKIVSFTSFTKLQLHSESSNFEMFENSYYRVMSLSIGLATSVTSGEKWFVHSFAE